MNGEVCTRSIRGFRLASTLAKSASLCLIALLGISALAQADPVLSPDNGHYYEYVPESQGAFWDAAKADALNRRYNGMKGHLATITSAVEQAFIASRFPSAKGWLGGYQVPDSASEASAAAGWQWVTGEPFAYSDWACTQPDDN